MYMLDDNLMAQQFDLPKLAVSGDPTPLAQNAATQPNARPFFGLPNRTACLIRPGQRRFNLSRFDRIGKNLEDVEDASEVGSFRLSPKLKTRAAAIVTNGSYDLWLFYLNRGLKTLSDGRQRFGVSVLKFRTKARMLFASPLHRTPHGQ